MRTSKQIQHVARWIEDAKLGIMSSETLSLSYRMRSTPIIQAAIALHYHVPIEEIQELMPEPFLEFYKGEHAVQFNIWLSRAWYNVESLSDPCEEDTDLHFQRPSELAELRRTRNMEDPDTLRNDKDLWQYGYTIPPYPSED